MSIMTLKRLMMLTMMVFVLSACSSKDEQMKKMITQQITTTEKALEKLQQDLEKDRIRNATLLTTYANQLAEKRPELADLTNQIAKDATIDGPLYQNLKDRLVDAKSKPESFLSKQEQLNELISIEEAAKSSLFNDALSDPVNVLADLSEGSLSRVNSISRAAEMQANGAQDFGPGSQMMGNPNYGQWRTDSSGMSFWEWYGMYALFGNLFDNDRRHYYRDWGRYRGYSYYNDYGRDRYSSPRQRKADTATYNRTKKSFASKGRTFKGPYSKRRVGSSALSRSSHTATKRSSFSKHSSFASNSNRSSGSMRNSSSRTSRSYSRGK